MLLLLALFLVSWCQGETKTLHSGSYEDIHSSIIFNQIAIEELLQQKDSWEQNTRQALDNISKELVANTKILHEELKDEIVAEVRAIISIDLQEALSDSLRRTVTQVVRRTDQRGLSEELEVLTQQYEERIQELESELRQQKQNLLEQERLTLSKDAQIREQQTEQQQQEQTIQHLLQTVQHLQEKLGQAENATEDQETGQETLPPKQTGLECEDTSSTQAVDCTDHWNQGKRATGRYSIFPVRGGGCVSVWCDMSHEGPWTVFLSRRPQPHQENFTRPWEDYKAGFGNASAEYWLGLEALHAITTRAPHKLHVKVRKILGDYHVGGLRSFAVGDEASGYEVSMTGGYGIGDVLAKNDGMMFSTLDKDNDRYDDKSCAELNGGGGWWHGGGKWWAGTHGNGGRFLHVACTAAFPTGPMPNTTTFFTKTMSWHLEDQNTFIDPDKVVMKIQPHDFEALST